MLSFSTGGHAKPWGKLVNSPNMRDLATKNLLQEKRNQIIVAALFSQLAVKFIKAALFLILPTPIAVIN